MKLVVASASFPEAIEGFFIVSAVSAAYEGEFEGFSLVDLVDVKGVGASAAGKLWAAGVETVEALADLDLRSVKVSGLSKENVATLRRNAARLLEARRTGELALVPGLGPSAERKLTAAGIKSIEDLVELDLRRNGVEGLSAENLQRLRRAAQYLVA